MDKSIEELNKIGTIKDYVTPMKSKLTGNNITAEKIRIEKDGNLVDAEVILTFVAGEESKPFVAYTLEGIDSKDDDYKATVDIGEVGIDNDELCLIAPSNEDHRNIVVPSIVAIGNSNLYDPEEVEKNVREAINDDNFKIIPLTSIDEYVGEYEEEYENNSILFNLKSTIPVLIPVAKLKIIKKIYMNQVDKMYAQATMDIDKEMSKKEIDKLINENDKKYYQVEELIEKFENLPNSEKYEKDIQQLEEKKEALDAAREIYVNKYDDSVVKINDKKQDDNDKSTEVESASEEIIEIPVISEENMPLETPDVADIKAVKVPEEKKEENPMEEMIDRNEDVPALTSQVEITLKLDEEEDKIDEIVEQKVGQFNSEMKTFKESLVNQYSEKYEREQSSVVRDVKKVYEEYINKLRSTFTELLDKCILEANNSVKELKNANANLQTSLVIAEDSLKDEKNENNNLRKTINDKDNEINDLRTKNEEYDKKNDEQKGKIESLEKDNKEKDDKITALDTENKKQVAENAKLNADLKSKDSRINELNANLEKAEEKNGNYKEQLDTMSKNMDEVRNEYKEYKINSEAEIAKLKAQLSSYKEFMDNMKSLQESMKGIAEVYSSDDDKKTK